MEEDAFAAFEAALAADRRRGLALLWPLVRQGRPRALAFLGRHYWGRGADIVLEEYWYRRALEEDAGPAFPGDLGPEERREASEAVRRLRSYRVHHRRFTQAWLPDAGEPAVGGVLGGYSLRAEAEGGFGRVFLARDSAGGKVALKIMKEECLLDDALLELSERELAAWELLGDHPHIVRLLDWLSYGGRPVLVLEFVEGGDLGALLRRGPLPPARALPLAGQLCDAMSYAHRKLGLVHRDLKPSNCLLTAGGDLKLTDFGLARSFDGSAGEVSAGTLPYLAPEQVRDGAALDTRADVHAFGVVLYEMLTRDRPDEGPRAREHIAGRVGRGPVPEAVARLILRCVSPEPRERPPDFAALHAELSEQCRRLIGEPCPPLHEDGLAVAALSAHVARLRTLQNRDKAGLLERANALHHLAGLFTENECYEEAVACCDEVLQASDDAGARNLREILLDAMSMRAERGARPAGPEGAE